MAKTLKLSERFLKEQYEKDETFFPVYDYYTPNFHKAIVSGKFYSRFDNLDLSLANMDLVDEIKRTKDKVPRQKYPWPVTESHRYGWFMPLVELDSSDRRFYNPILSVPFTKHEIRIRLDRTMQKPKFTGIPFKL